MSRDRILTIVLAGTLTLAILYSGYRVIGRQAAQPLENELLKIEGVKQVSVVKAERGQPTMIEIMPGVTSNLAFLYHRIDETVERRLTDYRIVIMTPPNPEAEKLFDSLSLLFYGGLARDEFENMAAAMSAAALKQGWVISIQMDERRVYVIMNKQDAVWYRVINRFPNLGEEENAS